MALLTPRLSYSSIPNEYADHGYELSDRPHYTTHNLLSDEPRKLLPAIPWEPLSSASSKKVLASASFSRKSYGRIGVDDEQKKRSTRIWDPSRAGWRTWIQVATISVGFIFVVNIIITVAFAVRFGVLSGVATLMVGECGKVSSVDSWLHVLINILSSSLLAASNYVMQVLNAPSRAQLDRAHAQGKYLHIGIPSFRNVMHVGWRQGVLWFLLAISTAPLHLLYVLTLELPFYKFSSRDL